MTVEPAMAPGRYEWDKTPKTKPPSEERQLQIPKVKVRFPCLLSMS